VTLTTQEFIDEDQLPTLLGGKVQFDWDSWIDEQLEKERVQKGDNDTGTIIENECGLHSI